MTQDNNATHWVLGGALLLIGLFVIIALVLTRSQAADDVTTTLNVNNTAPTVSNVRLCPGSSADPAACTGSTTITPNSVAGTDTYSIVGLITDTNGVDDLASLSAKLFRTSLTSDVASADPNNAYLVSDTLPAGGTGCTVTDGPTASTQKYFTCDVSLQYYIDATNGANTTNGAYDEDWTVWAQATDDSATTGINSSTLEVNSNLVINTCASVDYGSLGLGVSSPSGVGCSIASWSNIHTDITASATALDCAANGGIGSIPAANQRISSLDAGYAAMTTKLDLSGTGTSFTDLDLHHRVTGQDAGIVTDTLYHGVLVPDTGVYGTCTGTETLTAAAGELDT